MLFVKFFSKVVSGVGSIFNKKFLSLSLTFKLRTSGEMT